MGPGPGPPPQGMVYGPPGPMDPMLQARPIEHKAAMEPGFPPGGFPPTKQPQEQLDEDADPTLEALKCVLVCLSS
jgi:hypothetical protein